MRTRMSGGVGGAELQGFPLSRFTRRYRNLTDENRFPSGPILSFRERDLTSSS